LLFNLKADHLKPQTGKIEDLSNIILSELGTIEGIAQGLTQIMIFSDQIEDPVEDTSNQLLKAVKENFIKGVKYSFFVSPSHFYQKDEYFKMYEGYAKGLIRKKNLNFALQDLIEIQPLSTEWGDFPYIFYICRGDFGKNGLLVFGFRGTELREGIACSYVFLEPELAKKVLDLSIQAHKNVNLLIDRTTFDLTDFANEIEVKDNILQMNVS